jgi:hypothetical protein
MSNQDAMTPGEFRFLAAFGTKRRLEGSEPSSGGMNTLIAATGARLQLRRRNARDPTWYRRVSYRFKCLKVGRLS